MSKEHGREAADGDQPVFLRHTIRPYIVLLVIFVAVMIFTAGVAIAKRQLNMLYADIVLPFLFYFAYVWPGLAYKVSWNSRAVIMHASGIKPNPLSIRYQDIDRVVYETAVSDALAETASVEMGLPAAAVSRTRPTQRIVIYGRGSGMEETGAQFVDVSLKHFALDDIRTLLRKIARQRPDLAVPKEAGGLSLE